MWGWIVGIATGIWAAVTTAADVAVAALVTVVSAIWNTLRTIGTFLHVFAGAAWGVLRTTWDEVLSPVLHKIGGAVWTALRATWEDVLKPIVKTLRGWYDWLHEHVWTHLQSLMKWLVKVRTYVLDFYKHYIRPILDIIGATRDLLKLLEALHLKFAAALDAYLGKVESAIDRPFQLVLSKLNEVIGIVNRVVTLDGLLQRVALVNSLVRDYKYAWRALANPWRSAFVQPPSTALSTSTRPPTQSDVAAALRGYVEGAPGEDADTYAGVVAAYRAALQSAG